MDRIRLHPQHVALLKEMPQHVREEFEQMGEFAVSIWHAEGRFPSAELKRFAPAWIAEQGVSRERREKGRYVWLWVLALLGAVGAFWAVAATHDWDERLWSWIVAPSGGL